MEKGRRKAMITWDSVLNWLLHHGVNIVIILVVGAIIWLLLMKLIPPIVERSVSKTRGESKKGLEKRTNTIVSVLTQTGRIIIVITVIMMILSEIGVPVGPMLAGFGIAGVAVGFGAQYLVRDLIAGLFIISENQYRVGDVAQVAGATGLVEEITLRKTVLRDVDGVVHHIPNGEIRVASNYARHFARVNLDIPVSYDTDLEKAMEIINQVGQEIFEDVNWKDRMITPPKAIRVNKWGDSSIDIRVMGDVKPMEQWAAMGEVRLRLKKAFDANGIEIPWPHTKVYFGNSMDEARKSDK